MLQQTQVKTALPYYERFLEAYPRLEDLADAEEEDVLDLWAGLGYYSRARNLHHCARRVKEHYQGVFPDRIEDLLGLPGIGRYSAGAILSIAFGKAHPVVDGNVKRVMSRYLAVRDGLAPKAIWSALETIVSEASVAERISDFNQGLMELGALVCTPRNPDCTACPLESDCLARQAGIEKEVPRASRETRTVTEEFTVAVIRRSDGFLMTRNDDGPYLKGFWEFPKVEGRLSEDDLAAAVRSRHGIKIRPGRTLKEIRHAVTFRRLRFLPVLAESLQQEIPESFRWGIPGGRGFPVSAYIHKIAALLPEQGTPGTPKGNGK
jgi:A/G-specific adenine glycosylase